jgi:hypothetical protein
VVDSKTAFLGDRRTVARCCLTIHKQLFEILCGEHDCAGFNLGMCFKKQYSVALHQVMATSFFTAHPVYY